MDFYNGLTYKDFKVHADKDVLEMILNKKHIQDDYFLNTNLESFSQIAKIENNINIAVFSSVKCPDAATAIPLLLNLADLNPKIKVKFFLKSDYDDYLKSNINEAKIPTILVLDKDNNIVAKYCEFPLALKRLLVNVSKRKEADKIIEDFRSGLYNDSLLLELRDLILGNISDEYISFDKTSLPE